MSGNLENGWHLRSDGYMNGEFALKHDASTLKEGI